MTRRLPLSSRLGLLFALLAMLGFGASGLVLHRYLGGVLVHERHHALRAKLEVVTQMVEHMRVAGQPVSTEWADLREQLDAMHDGDRSTHYWVFCTEPGGGTCSPPNAALQTATPNEWRHVRFEAAGIEPVSANSGATLQIQGITLPERGVTGTVQVVVGGDESMARGRLRTFAWLIGTITVAGGVLTSMLGAAVARWGLRPLALLVAQAEQIGPTRLDARLPVPDEAPELTLLAGAFNGALERLETAYRQLETFNADVAHELRSPLAALIGNAEVALSRNRDSEHWRETMVQHLDALQRLAAMVGDMLFLARADHGERAADLAPLDFAAVVEQTTELFEPLATERGLVLQAEVDPAAQAPGNAALLRRALVNLVANAVQYGDASGPITLAVRAEPGRCCVEVSNAGVVLDDATLQHMFDRFYRGDVARSRHDSHHGLGLSIVRAVARMHGGDVFAAAAEGRVRVGLWLPTGPDR